MSDKATEAPRLTDHEYALLTALAEVVAQCHNVIDVHRRRAGDARHLTLAEAQELAVLHICLDDLSDVQATESAEPSQLGRQPSSSPYLRSTTISDTTTANTYAGRTLHAPTPAG